MAEIVGIGCAIFDLMMILDRFPEDDEKMSGRESKIQCGGPCAVALIAASKLGVSSAYQGKFGDDTYGLTTRDNLGKYGVDLSGVKIIEGARSPLCVVLSNQSNGHRACVGGGVSSPELQMTAEDVDLSALEQAKYFHCDGQNYEAALCAAKRAHELGVKVSMDLDGGENGREELIGLVDILIPSERAARMIAGTDDLREAARILKKRFNPETLVITMGPEGGMILENDEIRRYPAFHVNAIDSNGAGDVFHGAFLAAKVKGFTDYEAARFASAASAIKCTHFGASEGAPSWEMVEEFLKSRE